MKFKKTSVPRSCYKYYQSCTLEMFLEHGIAKESEIGTLEEIIVKVLECYNMKLLGWAAAKDKYFEVLSNEGIGLVEIVQLEDGQKILVDIIDTSVYEISRDKLDSLFED